MTTANLSAPIRDALVGSSDITDLLPAYLDSFPVFTRRPVPKNAPYPMIIISPDISYTDFDGVNDQRTIIARDVSVYGKNSTPESYRKVEDIAYLIRDMFDRSRTVITVDGWHLITTYSTTMHPAPVDDEQTVGRLISLEIRLARVR